MNTMGEEQFLGKKVFFLYPPSVVKEELIEFLVFSEYEVFTLKDHHHARRVCLKYPDSILFINIDEGMSITQWEEYTRSLKTDDQTAGLSIGVVTYNRDDELKEKILLNWEISAGFIELKLGYEQSKAIILKVLQANEAKGRRKYLRVTPPVNSATLNMQYQGRLIQGNILDISSFGMSCTFSEVVDLKKNSLLDDLQLKLKGVLVSTQGIVLGGRLDEKPIYVIIFDHRKQPINKKKIQGYIKNVLQETVKDLVQRS